MGQYNPRIAARTALARLLRDQFMAQATAAGITQADLETIIDAGTNAALADAQQHEQIAVASAERSKRKAQKDAVFQKEDALRNRLPAVIEDVRVGGEPNLALWLEHLSFARYRFREFAPEEPTTPAAPAEPTPTTEDEDIRRVTRVRREDVPTRARALSALCHALLKPGREPIITAFEARGMPAAEIESLAQQAEAVADAGRNLMPGVEATDREAEAVANQKRKWIQIRRMVRSAIVGVPDLEAKYAEC